MANATKQKEHRCRCRARRFRDEDGYALTLALIALPLIVGFAVLVIDASRITNLHTDLQNAVDAMAIAGARELDGRNDAITRAEAAVADIAENQAWFSEGGAGLPFGTRLDVTYVAGDDAASTVRLKFLKSIPDSDDTPLTTVELDKHLADNPNEAKYLLVRTKPQSVKTMFPLPVSGRDDVDVSTEAVATYTAAACDVTPIYICNPFPKNDPDTGEAKTINEYFTDGDVYGKEILFQNTGAASTLPGNFGFLRTYGSGANVLAEALATGSPGVCYSSDGVDTEPGGNVGPVEQGINTRLGLYKGSYGSAANSNIYRPDTNSRIGQTITDNLNKDCADFTPEEDPGQAMGLPRGEGGYPLPSGGLISDPISDFEFRLYWHISHEPPETSPYTLVDGKYVLPEAYNPPDPSDTSLLDNIRAQALYPGTPPADFTPSRYDIYRYEIAHPELLADASLNGETGAKNMCHSSGTTLDERRMIFSAIIDCETYADQLQGAATNIPVEAFALMFLTRPAVSDGSTKEFSLEIVDVTGKGGLGTIEDFFREESVLVR